MNFNRDLYYLLRVPICRLMENFPVVLTHSLLLRPCYEPLTSAATGRALSGQRLGVAAGEQHVASVLGVSPCSCGSCAA